MAITQVPYNHCETTRDSETHLFIFYVFIGLYLTISEASTFYQKTFTNTVPVRTEVKLQGIFLLEKYCCGLLALVSAFSLGKV